MDNSAFKATLRLLTTVGFESTHEYNRKAFGSWYVEIASTPPLRLVWDGKDGWLILQERTDEMFNGQPVWKDLEVIKSSAEQTPERALSLVERATGSLPDR